MNIRRCLLIVALLAAAVSALAAPIRISDLAGPKLARLIGQKIVVDGYYSDVSIPMIADSPQRIQFGPMYTPAQEAAHFQPITGQVPANTKTGDHIQWTLNVRAPRANDPVHVRRLPAVLEPVVAGGTATRLAATQIPLALRQINPNWFKQLPKLVSTKYAVLLGGGYSNASNYTCFWNDMHATYQMLLAAGYKASNIYVLYWNGTPAGSGMTVNYADTAANIRTVFQTLAGKMTANDSLYVDIDCHGGGFLKQSAGGETWGSYCGRWDNSGFEIDAISEAYYNTDLNGNGNKTDILGVDECLGLSDGSMLYDKDFAADVNLIQNYSHMAFVMSQCFAGGFIKDLSGPNRVIIANTSENKCGRCNGSEGPWCDFFYRFIAAVRGSYPDTGVAVNADTNHDGKVSLKEAYLFARPFVTNEEEPTYGDDGTGIVVDVPGQGNSQGALGASLFIPLQ